MAGLYIHVPFCKSRCTYCGFYSTTSSELRQRYVDAVCKEMVIRSQKATRQEEHIGTIYLGGGTPSQLSASQLSQIFDAIYNIYKVESCAEITIECNPDDVTADFAIELSALPVNRISMGAQTFDEKRLQFLHRRHSAVQVAEATERLRRNGIHNISIDLMYGFPEETLDDWLQDIRQVLALNVEHVSSYCLTYEEGTPLYRLLQKGKISETDEETERLMYEKLIDLLTESGYEHYEISNFAKPGFRSRHNSSYWTGSPYIGIGAAAHSFDINSRSWNIADIRQYLEGIEKGIRIFEQETLDEDTRYNDTITIALRTCEGLDLGRLSERHRNYCLENAQRYITDGLLTLDDSHLRLTRQGLFVSDMIMSGLMLV